MVHVGDGSQAEHSAYFLIVLRPLGGHHVKVCGALRMADVEQRFLSGLFEDVVDHLWYVIHPHLVPGEVPKVVVFVSV